MDNTQIHSEVFENSSDCFCVFEVTADNRFKLEAVNRAAEKMSHRSRTQIVGQYLEDITSSEQLTKLVLAKYRQCVASRLPVYWEDQYDLLAGRTYLESTVIPICNSEGRVQRIVAVSRDKTEHRQMEDALRQSEQRSREVFENSSDSIYLFDVTDDGRFRVAAANPAMERATGLSEAEILGKYLEELVSERVLQQTLPMYRRCLETGSIVTFDVQAGPPTGYRWLETSVIPLPDRRGDITRLMVVARDISERKLAEQMQRRAHEDLERRVAERTLELQQGNERLQQEIREREAAQSILAQRSEELARIDAELEAFSYSLSHDLRAPLRAIDGFTQMLYERCDAKFDSTEQDYLRRVKVNARRMNLLINGMLTLFRMSRHEMQQTTVDLSALAQEILADIERTHLDRHVTVVIEPQLKVHADASLMRIALENMLSNAWKFTRNAPAARIDFGCTQHGGNPSYFVRDNGAGFDMSQADRVFTPFQRLHSESEFEGTGIGLAIVQRVIGRHGGRIWIDSQVNRGTTVHFALGAANGHSASNGG